MSLLERLKGEVAGVPTFGAIVALGNDVVLSHDSDAPLCACSTAKVAVAMAVMTLVDEGMLDLDAPVHTFAPDLRFPDAHHAASITLRHLLSHTSGLGDTSEVEPDPQAALSRLEVVAAPGRAFRYSNVAFDVAHETAARVAGQDGFGLLRERVLDPLEMSATRPAARFPRGVLETTARDLLRLATELIDGTRVLSARSRNEMTRVHADSYTAAPARYYGLGLVIEHWLERVLLAHGGGLGQFGSAFVVDPLSRAVAAFLFDAPAGDGVSAHAYLDAALARETRPRPPRPATVDWHAYLGAYRNGAVLAEAGGRPVLAWKGRRTHLRAVDDRLFAGEGRISVGLLPGEPTMISVNDFIAIGARPAERNA